MAVEVVGYASRGASGALSLTALTGGIDTAARANDLVIVVMCNYVSTSSANLSLAIATPSGYSQWVDTFRDGGSLTDTNSEIWFKVQGVTPDTSITIPANVETATAYVLRGHDLATPLDVAISSAFGIYNVPDNDPVTTVTPGAMVLAIATRQTAENTTTAPVGYSSFSKYVDTTRNNWICVAAKIVTTPGVENPGIWQNATDGNLVQYAIATIAIRPAGGKIKVWNGSAWVAKPMKVWNGSSWVAKPVKFWNGAAWVVTNY
jgi:hypothetical protein